MKKLTPTEQYFKELRREQRPWLVLKICAAGVVILVAYIVMTSDRPPGGTTVNTINPASGGLTEFMNR